MGRRSKLNARHVKDPSAAAEKPAAPARSGGKGKKQKKSRAAAPAGKTKRKSRASASPAGGKKRAREPSGASPAAASGDAAIDLAALARLLKTVSAPAGGGRSAGRAGRPRLTPEQSAARRRDRARRAEGTDAVDDANRRFLVPRAPAAPVAGGGAGSACVIPRARVASGLREAAAPGMSVSEDAVDAMCVLLNGIMSSIPRELAYALMSQGARKISTQMLQQAFFVSDGLPGTIMRPTCAMRLGMTERARRGAPAAAAGGGD